MISRILLASLALPLLAVSAAASCGDHGSNSSGGSSSSSSSASGGSGGSGGDPGTGGFFAVGGAGGGGPDGCDPPEILIALDRTLTMHKTPNGETPTDGPDYPSSKWYQAVTAIEKMVASPRDKQARYGLELWPRDPGGGTCITLAERVTDTKQATNPLCQTGEIAVPPALGNGGAIQQYLDPATTRICISTPTGEALLAATDHLLKSVTPGRDQYVVLVTDGADWDQSCPDPNPLPIVQQLAASGIRTFVVGFSAEGAILPGGVGAGFLNDMACAGQTAKDFPAPCEEGPGGFVAKDPSVGILYLQASDAAGLEKSLAGVADGLCCDCVK